MSTHVIVGTRDGDVRGCLAGGVNVFKGIPYAAPPFGENRLRPPQPVTPWTGVRDALAFGPKTPQPSYPPHVAPLIPPEECGTGQECLNLNIWSPELAPARRPVMVWIPGGAFGYHATGACAWYDGTAFARDNIVCVTIGYRVGPDGFLYVDGSANRALLDQVAALEWVKGNIAAFGGDPDNVTVFGESAGAMSIGSLLAMPRADGLFHRAILQSGAARPVMSVESARRVAKNFAASLGVPPTRDGLAAVPEDRFLRAQVELEGDLAAHADPVRWGYEVAVSMMPWQPILDGQTIPALPIDRLAAGASARVDVLIGTNVDEHRLFMMVGNAIDQITDDTLIRAVTAYGLPVARTLAAYRAEHPGATPGDLLAALQTDWFWRIPAIRLADAHAKHGGTTYMYEFAWRSPEYHGRLGACHALEVPFVFDVLGNRTEYLLGANPPRALAEFMHAAWVGFATTGRCTWPAYDLARRATMRFEVPPHVVEDPRAVERALWDGVGEPLHVAATAGQVVV